MNEDQTLSDTDQPATGMPGLADAAVDTILSLDEIMSSARRPERVARICIRADLEAEYLATLEELSDLVDEHGQVLSGGDQALADGSRAHELVEKAQDLAAQMRAASRTVRFRGMHSEDWDKFWKAHEGPDNKPKDMKPFNEQIIARCAIAPTLTVEQIRLMRTQISPTQYTRLANKAYEACSEGGLGVDVPKSLNSLPAPRPSSQSGS